MSDAATSLGALLDWYNPAFVLQYANEFARGLSNTMIAALASLLGSLAIATSLAIASIYADSLVRLCISSYANVIRATPLLIQIYIVYYALPLVFPATARWPEIILGVIALTIHTAPYMAEIIRAGIVAVPRGQTEGAMAVGMTVWQRLRHVVLPQAFANSLPALLGQAAILIKDTSLLSLITVFDLLSAGLLLNSERVRPNEGFLTVAVIYLLIYCLTVLLARVAEQRLGGAQWNRRPGS